MGNGEPTFTGPGVRSAGPESRRAAFGNKRPGSAAGYAAADRIADAFRAAGLETSLETFQMPVWQDQPTTMRVAAGPGAGTTFATETFPYSATGDARAEVVDLGNGGPADYEGKDVRGKVVLVDRSDTYHRTVQLQQATQRGAAAMLLVSASPDNLIQTGTVKDAQRPPATLIGVTVGAADGAKLRGLMAQGPVTLQIGARGARVDGTARNVIGVRRGTTHPDRYIVVAGHYDSWHAGAFDNCTAIGSLLAMVQHAKDRPSPYTTLFVGWDGEEPGLNGSYSWLADHPDLLGKIVLNVNLEETASLGPPDFALTSGAPALLTAITTSAALTGYTPVLAPFTAYRTTSGGVIATDIEGFYASGIQGTSTASLSDYYHTTQDTPDKVDGSRLETATRYLERLLQTVQQLPPEALTLREVPEVRVSAPATAAAGAPVDVDMTITGPAGAPVTGVRPEVLAAQRDNWGVAEGTATELGGGRYRWTLPAGTTDVGLTDFRVQVAEPAYLATGFARTDQSAGGLVAGPARVCRSRRVIRLRVRRTVGGKAVRRVTLRADAGKARVLRRTKRYVVGRLDLRGVPRKRAVTVRITARLRGGGTARQSRAFRTCTPKPG